MQGAPEFPFIYSSYSLLLLMLALSVGLSWSSFRSRSLSFLTLSYAVGAVMFSLAPVAQRIFPSVEQNLAALVLGPVLYWALFASGVCLLPLDSGKKKRYLQAGVLWMLATGVLNEALGLQLYWRAQITAAPIALVGAALAREAIRQPKCGYGLSAFAMWLFAGSRAFLPFSGLDSVTQLEIGAIPYVTTGLAALVVHALRAKRKETALQARVLELELEQESEKGLRLSATQGSGRGIFSGSKGSALVENLRASLIKTVAISAHPGNTASAELAADAQGLLGQIDSLMALERAELLPLTTRELDLGEQAQNALLDISASMPALVRSVPVFFLPLPTWLGDPVATKLGFQALLRNALVSANRGNEPSVHVGTLAEDEDASAPGVLLFVQDTGPGAAAEQAQEVLNSSGECPGLDGLSISVARTCFERQGGRLWVESQPGEGLTVFVSLPRVAA